MAGEWLRLVWRVGHGLVELLTRGLVDMIGVQVVGPSCRRGLGIRAT